MTINRLYNSLILTLGLLVLYFCFVPASVQAGTAVDQFAAIKVPGHTFQGVSKLDWNNWVQAHNKSAGGAIYNHVYDIWGGPVDTAAWTGTYTYQNAYAGGATTQGNSNLYISVGPANAKTMEAHGKFRHMDASINPVLGQGEDKAVFAAAAGNIYLCYIWKGDYAAVIVLERFKGYAEGNPVSPALMRELAVQVAKGLPAKGQSLPTGGGLAGSSDNVSAGNVTVATGAAALLAVLGAIAQHFGTAAGGTARAPAPVRGQTDAAGRVFTNTYGWVNQNQIGQELARLNAARNKAVAAGQDVGVIDAKLAVEQGKLKAAQRELAEAGERKQLVQESMTTQQQSAASYNKHAGIYNALSNTATVTGYAADLGVDVLAGITGPAGKTVKSFYTVGKGLGKGVGLAIRDGGNVAANIASGAGEGVFDLATGVVTDKITGFVGKSFNNKIPLFHDYNPGIELAGKTEAGYVKDIFLNKILINSANTEAIRQGIETSIKGTVQGFVQGQGTSYGTDLVKNIIGFKN